MNISKGADIHCHLLPHWDDGPRTVQESLQMAQGAVQNGISDIFVTPHAGRDLSSLGLNVPAAREIPQAVQILQKALQEAGLALNVWPGAEVVIAPDLPERLAEQPFLTLGGWQRHVLVELPPGAPWTSGVDDVLFQIALRGVTPIVAHPERYPDVQRDLDCVERAASRGVLFQLTAASLQVRGIVRDTSRHLLENGLISFVASDAHTPHDIWPQQVEKSLSASLGPEGCQKIRQNARALFPNPIDSMETSGAHPSVIAPVAPARNQESHQEKGRRSFWSRFRKRQEK